ncbi:MAG: hypothetical protein NTW03_07945, partial [Verrucomicrobia bacterium]|nr:hypothetical protein [Verrucomicrobiota bacterium]
SFASGTAATTASYFFRVAGTNQTSREAVSLAGSLSTNTLRLEGKLRIGTNTEQPLKAVRIP